jgi:DNA-binding NtrC family response regulator
MVKAKQKVFVVDDDEQIADMVSFVISEAQFDVETFYDASSALQRAGDCQPDILVSDIDMPEMGGITLAKALRKQNPDCTVILMSGNSDWKIHEHLVGSHDFVLLPKPFPLNQLLGLIRLSRGS